ncbi:MAG TPA: dockerin type I domain-containing protein [Candidatus Sumerlaeota bacterium]|nr:MAG: hypothetical protein BWY12_01795 [candidate division BRC1 bacterium ADurb.Bin183]HON49521.1 dockerin type I domain-containing protein [Candidatus Sumerlaeota bacterium]
MKEKCFIPVIVCALLLCVSGLFAATLNVGAGKPYATISAALADAGVGDTIIVDPGTYAEAIKVTKPGIKIYGPNRDVEPYTQNRGPEAVIVHTTPPATVMVDLGAGATAAGVEFNGFKIDGENKAIQTGKTAAQAGSDDIFAYNIVTNFDGKGVGGGGPNCQIAHNLVTNIINLSGTGGNTGIHTSTGGTAGATLKIIYNTLININYAGIQPGNQSYYDVMGNNIQNTGRHGINIGSNSRFVRVIGNRIANVNYQDNRTDEDTGGIRAYCNPPFINSDIEIAYNTVENAMNGLHFRGSMCDETRDEWNGVDGCNPFSAGGCTYPGVLKGEYQHPMGIPPNMTVHDNNFINCLNWGINAFRPIQPGDCGYTDPPVVLDAQNNYIEGNINGDVSTTVTQNNNPAASIILGDSDGDGIDDWEEIYIYGTDPNDADQDNDGVLDGVQLKLGGDPKNGTPAPGPVPGPGDSDGDGYYDWYEALVGTSWTDKNDYPKLGDINKNGVIDNGDAAIVYNFVLGKIEGFGFDPDRMDVNQDGVVNNLDANILFNKFLGIAGYGILPYRLP